MLFEHFALILAHMCNVRKATTCARLVLQEHAENCSSVTRAHLTQLMGLMSEGSARYAWYLHLSDPLGMRGTPILTLFIH